MRKLKIASIVFLSGVTICLCAILLLFLFGGDGEGSIFGIGRNEEGRGYYAVVMEKEFSPEDIRSLKIDYGMTYNDVFFYPAEGESIIVREYMNFTPKERQISQAEVKGGELSVKGVRRNNFLFFSFGFRDAYTEIYLPEDLSKQLEEVYVKTLSGGIQSNLSFKVKNGFGISSTSGDMTFPEVDAEKIQASSTSGYITITAVLAEKITVSTTSGDIELEQAEGSAKLSSTSGNIILNGVKGKVTASTTSGDISLGQAEGDMDLSSTRGTIRLQEGKGNFNGDTTSGDIRIDGLKGIFQIDTTSGNTTIMDGSGWGKAGSVSGDMKLFLNSLEGDITISTTSGNIDLQLPETVSLTLDFDSTSGECTTFFDDMLRFSKRGNQAEGTYGGGDNRVDVSTVSGDLRITK